MINMKKKFISLLMIIAMMFSMLPANVVDIKAATGKTAIISAEGRAKGVHLRNSGIGFRKQCTKMG